MLKDLEKQGKNIQSFKTAALSFWDKCIEYLNEWTVYFEEIENFDWIFLRSLILWTAVKETLEFILEKIPNFHINDNELFDEVSCV